MTAMPNELDDSELGGPRNEGPLLTLMRVPVVKSGTRQEWKLCPSGQQIFSLASVTVGAGGGRDKSFRLEAEQD